MDSFVDPAHLDEMKPYPGIDFLGMGYDVYHGNPEGDEKLMGDPGFRLPIRQISYTGVSMTRDNKYLTPDGSMSIPLYACARSEIARDVSTQARYSNSLTEDRKITSKKSDAGGVSYADLIFSGSAKWGTSSFSSASVGFQHQQHLGYKNNSYRIDVKSYCEKCAPPEDRRCRRAAAAAAAAAGRRRPPARPPARLPPPAAGTRLRGSTRFRAATSSPARSRRSRATPSTRSRSRTNMLAVTAGRTSKASHHAQRQEGHARRQRLLRPPGRD